MSSNLISSFKKRIENLVKIIKHLRCFSTEAKMRFSSGGMTSASLSTPTIKAVWKMPNKESMQIMQRETSELNSKLVRVPVAENVTSA